MHFDDFDFLGLALLVVLLVAVRTFLGDTFLTTPSSFWIAKTQPFLEHCPFIINDPHLQNSNK